MTITQGATGVAKQNKDWLSWFNSRDSAITINKSQQETLFKTFDYSVNDDELIVAIGNHEETAFLHKVNVGNHRVAIFHHLTVAGGTIYDNGAKEFGFLQGLDIDCNVMTPDIDVLKVVTTNTDTAVPAFAGLMGAKSKDEVAALVTSATVKYRARNILPIPPFLLPIIHEAISTFGGDATEILLKVTQGIKDFDNKYGGDAEYQDKAKTKCKDIVYWLYLVSTGNVVIASINTIACTNPKLKETLQTKTKTSLQVATAPSPPSFANQLEESLKRPFEVLAATSSSTSDFMEKLTQLQKQSSEKSTKTFKKIPAKYQQMILIATSTSEVTTLDYDAEAAEFFKCSTPLHAQVMLNSVLETEGIECSVSSAMATTLLYGSFLWRNALSPAGLAASVLTSEGIIRNDTLQEGMVLDFATKFDMSEISLSKLTKTQVLFPKDVEELTHRIRGIQTLASFFFKKHGFMSQGLKQVVNFCLDNRRLLKTKIFLDHEFIAKFLCSVDERIYMWLKQCSISKSVMDTDLTLINYSSLLQDITLNRFTYNLPPTTASLATQNNDDKQKTQTRGTSGKRDVPEIFRNNDRVDGWKLRQGESWYNIFRNKAIEGPMLSTKCHPCLKFHVRGSCYVDCRNRASHCVLKGEDKKKVSEFIKTLRGE